MARPKKVIEPIVGPGKEPENKLTVQKSLPLFSLWRSDMSLAEFKILDTYLSRINSRDPEKRSVVFTKGELESLLGVKKINKQDLVGRLKGLYRAVDVEDSPNKFRTVGLFEEAYGEIDENGLWTVKLTCTAKAMKYIFNIEKIGYLRYKLRCITSLTSRYTYVLFMYLESNRFRKTWEVSVADLRQILNCDQDELYKEYKRFNERILKRSQKELLEKTECRFDYEPVKTGRRVTAVRFTLETLADSIEPAADGQMTIDEYIPDMDDPNEIYAYVLPKSFTPEEVEAIKLLALPKVYCDPWGPMPKEALVADYLKRKVAIMNAQAAKHPIPHPYNYLKAMIERDEDQ